MSNLLSWREVGASAAKRTFATGAFFVMDRDRPPQPLDRRDYFPRPLHPARTERDGLSVEKVGSEWWVFLWAGGLKSFCSRHPTEQAADRWVRNEQIQTGHLELLAVLKYGPIRKALLLAKLRREAADLDGLLLHPWFTHERNYGWRLSPEGLAMLAELEGEIESAESSPH